MRDFCKISKDILSGNFIDTYFDKSIAILVSLMKFKVDKETYIYNKDFLFEYLHVTRTNVAAKKLINESFDKLINNKILVEDDLFSSLSVIKINESVICNKPWLKVKYKDFDTIFSATTKYDKYKILLVYLNIIKWFHGEDGYSFPTNERLMLESGIKSEQSLMKIQDELVRLDLLCMKTYTFYDNNRPTTKNFYAYKGNEKIISEAIENYVVNLDCKNRIILNQEIANKKRSASMKIEQMIRKGVISKIKGNKLKIEARKKIDDDYGVSNCEDEELFG